MQEAEGSAGSNLSLEITDFLEPGMLGAQHRAVEINQRSNLVFNSRHGDHFHPFAFVVKRDIGIDGVPVFCCFLL